MKPSDNRTRWITLAPEGRPCMSWDVLEYLEATREEMWDSDEVYDYAVLHSETEGVFNLGGDLALFRTCIEAGDRELLHDYATSCIEALYAHYTAYGHPLITVSLVQGRALGGGFEAALSSDVIIAEEGATFCFPEAKFGMFPGMGGYALLCTRVRPRLAEILVTEGRVYTAREMEDWGIVDKLVPDGSGLDAVQEYIDENQKLRRVQVMNRKVARTVSPVTLAHLEESINLWVEAAMATTKVDRRLMAALVSAQEKLGTPRGNTSGDPVAYDLSTAA